jgi:hypothetical protein
MYIRYYICRTLLRCIYFLCQLTASSKINQKSCDIRTLIQENKSFIRWGDGETALMLGSNTYFQDSDFSTSLLLWNLLIQANKKGVTILFPKFSKMCKSSAFSSTIELQKIIYSVKRENISSDCALEFRDSKDVRELFISTIYSLKNIVLICSEKFRSQEKRVRALFGQDIKIIYCPSQNAYLSIDELEKISLADNIILAAGPVIKSQIIQNSSLEKDCFIADFGHGMDRVLDV